MTTPQLVIQDFSGYHNSDLEKTSARLIKGASWKKQRTILIMPASDMIPTKVSLALQNLAFPPNNGVVRILIEGMEVGDAYSRAIEGILADPNLSQWEYILTVEHDNLPPADGAVSLIQALSEHEEYSCIGGGYFTKGPQGVYQAWGDPKDPVLNFRPQPPDLNAPDGLQEVCGTGMGFNLWRLSMFKDPRLPKPLFETRSNTTQDLAFWTEARKYGYRCAIKTDVKVGHLDYDGSFGPKGMVW